jgi:hypothetical protein
MADTPSRVIVLEAVVAERDRQEIRYGMQNHANQFWNVIASKKVGDVAHQIQEQSDSALFIEVVQTCAVYFAWAEAIHLNNRDKWKF